MKTTALMRTAKARGNGYGNYWKKQSVLQQSRDLGLG
jgi:hypothetical protein